MTFRQPCVVQKRRPLADAPMTIAAGFLFNGGLLLCSDTQYTGHIKLMGSKILPHEYSDGSKSAFITVGHRMYSRMTVQLLEYSIEDLAPSERSLSKIHTALVAGIQGLYKGHIFKHPRKEDIGVQLLIGIWSMADKEIGFFSTEETAVARMYGYDCLGSGESFAQRIIRPKYKRTSHIGEKPKHTEQEVREIASQALKETKTYDAYCGGDDECLILKDDGGMSPVGRLFNKSKSK